MGYCSERRARFSVLNLQRKIAFVLQPIIVTDDSETQPTGMNDYDGYVLTPLPEAEDPTSTEMDDDNEDDEVSGGDHVAVADDYVQSLVTIESNWANGRISK